MESMRIEAAISGTVTIRMASGEVLVPPRKLSPFSGGFLTFGGPTPYPKKEGCTTPGSTLPPLSPPLIPLPPTDHPAFLFFSLFCFSPPSPRHPLPPPTQNHCHQPPPKSSERPTELGSPRRVFLFGTSGIRAWKTARGCPEKSVRAFSLKTGVLQIHLKMATCKWCCFPFFTLGVEKAGLKWWQVVSFLGRPAHEHGFWGGIVGSFSSSEGTERNPLGVGKLRWKA